MFVGFKAITTCFPTKPFFFWHLVNILLLTPDFGFGIRITASPQRANTPVRLPRTRPSPARSGGALSEGGEGGGLVLISCIAEDPCTPTMPGRSTSNFHQLGRHRVHQVPGGRWGGGGRVLISSIAVDPRISTTPGRATSGFHQPGRHRVHQARSAARCSASRTKSELHPTKNHL